jgi:hypothetical protein
MISKTDFRSWFCFLFNVLNFSMEEVFGSPAGEFIYLSPARKKKRRKKEMASLGDKETT